MSKDLQEKFENLDISYQNKNTKEIELNFLEDLSLV